jgi:DHA2 family multidrug resistance protein
MEVLDTSIANVALPHIAGSLSAGQDESTWVLTSYLVSNAIVLPLSGWLSSIMGRKRFYMSCVALFTVSSCLCGFAPNLSMLIVFRILQGVGGGGLQPSEQAILADTFAPAKRGMAFAVYGIAVVMARPNARRLDHRQFQLALDFFHQYSRRHTFALAHIKAHSGSSVLQAP